MKNKTLLWIWLGLYILTVIFGCIPATNGILQVFQFVLAVLFFVPAVWLTVNAHRQQNEKLRLFLWRISCIVLAITFLLLLLNILLMAAPTWVGELLQVLMTLLAPPAGNGFALGLFLWCCLFYGTFSFKKPSKD